MDDMGDEEPLGAYMARKARTPDPIPALPTLASYSESDFKSEFCGESTADSDEPRLELKRIHGNVRVQTRQPVSAAQAPDEVDDERPPSVTAPVGLEGMHLFTAYPHCLPHNYALCVTNPLNIHSSTRISSLSCNAGRQGDGDGSASKSCCIWALECIKL